MRNVRLRQLSAMAGKRLRVRESDKYTSRRDGGSDTTASGARVLAWMTKAVPRALAEAGTRLAGFLPLTALGLDVPVDFPALANLWGQKRISGSVVGDLHLLRIPKQLCVRDTAGNNAQGDPLGERSGDVEIRASRLAALARRNPIIVSAWCAIEHLRGHGHVVHLAHGHKAGAAAVFTGCYDTLVANENGSA